MGCLSFGAGAVRRTVSLFAISVCLATALPLLAAGAAHAISGYGSDTPAVAAQYPDSSASQLGPTPVLSDLGQAITRSPGGGLLATGTRKEVVLRDPKVRAQVRAEGTVIARKTTHAIATTAGLNPPQSGSIVLLIAGGGVVALGVFLRWRRGTQS